MGVLLKNCVKYLFLAIIISILYSTNIYAADCGSGIKDCACGDTLKTDYNLTSDLYCAGKGLILGREEIILDCQGFKILGNGTSSGVSFEFQNLYHGEVKNCVVDNFAYGIHINPITKKAYYTKLLNNIIKNNNHGIYLEEEQLYHSIIYSNTIIHNKHYGIYLSGRANSNLISNNIIANNSQGIHFVNYNTYNNITKNNFSRNKLGIEIEWFTNDNNNIWANDFYGGGISYSNTNNNYCFDGVPNNFYDGATGPDNCTCLYPVDELYIDSDVNFCKGAYYNVSDLEIVFYDIDIDCNGASFIGDSTEVFIRINGYDDVSLHGCNISNYYKGIQLNTYSVSIDHLKLYDNYFNNNNYGIHMGVGYLRESQIYNNEFRNNTVAGYYQRSLSYSTNFNNNLFIGNNVGIDIDLHQDSNNLYNNYTHNLITENVFGVRTGWGARSDRFEYNNIYSNTQYNLYNSDRFNLSAEYNYWGSVDRDKISSTIFDKNDDLTKGYVYFEPYLLEPADTSFFSICSGSFQAVSYDSSKDIVPDVSVYLEGLMIGNTSSEGVFNYNGLDLCSDDLDVTLKCKNDSINCGTKKVSFDFNDDYDYLEFDCTRCVSDEDLVLTDVSVDSNNVFFNITNYGIDFNNLEVNFKVQDKKGLISHDESLFININSTDEYYSDSITINLDEAELVHVYVDPSDNVNEPKDNNYLAVPALSDKVRAYLSVETGNDFVNDVIYDYLSGFVDAVSEEEAEIIIVVSLLDMNPIIKTKAPTSKESRWYVDSFSIYSNGKLIGSKPYNGLVVKEANELFIIGKGMDGVVASVKRMINKNDIFLNRNYIQDLSIINDYDSLGISVFDLMHSQENEPYYLEKNINFGNVVRKILYDNNFEIAIKTVMTTKDNVKLRMKYLNTQYSNNYIDAMNPNNKPVVIGNGAWTDMFSMEPIGESIAKDKDSPRDVYLIELTGGPDAECDACPNYSYEDLVDYYWPALISGVEEYSGKSKIDYVGYSTGCRVALDSLKNWSATGKNNAGLCYNFVTGEHDIDCDLSSEPVETFVGIACPGAFNADLGSPLSRLIQLTGRQTILFFDLANVGHVYSTPFMGRLVSNCIIDPDISKSPECIKVLKDMPDESKISLNLVKMYDDSINYDSDKQPGDGLEIDRIRLIYGKVELPEYLKLIFSESDSFVQVHDQQEILDGIISGNKDKVEIRTDHVEILNEKKTIEIIKEGIE